MSVLNKFFLISIQIIFICTVIIVGVFFDFYDSNVYSFLILVNGFFYLVYNKFKLSTLEFVQFFLIFSPFTISILWQFETYFDWGTGNNVYRYIMFQESTMAKVFTIGFYMTSALCLSRVIVTKPHRQSLPIKHIHVNRIGKIFILIFAWYLNGLSARTESIFDNGYGATEHIAKFAGGYVIGYVLIIYVATVEYINKFDDKLINRSLLFVIGYELIFNQVLVGSREIIGLLFSMMTILLIHYREQGKYDKIKKVYFLAFASILLMLSIGAFRGAISSGASDLSILNIFNNNPWNAILLSVLGYVDLHYMSVDFERFDYYINLAFSIFPGRINELLFDGEFGISIYNTPSNWYANYTGGGIYLPLPMLVILGPFFTYIILVVIFSLILFVSENKFRSFNLFFMYLSLIFICFRWYWYGDINGVRGLQAIFIVMVLHAFISKRVYD